MFKEYLLRFSFSCLKENITFHSILESDWFHITFWYSRRKINENETNHKVKKVVTAIRDFCGLLIWENSLRGIQRELEIKWKRWRQDIDWVTRNTYLNHCYAYYKNLNSNLENFFLDIITRNSSFIVIGIPYGKTYVHR